MKTRVIACLLALPFAASASGPVTVTLAVPSNARDAERGVVDFTVRNEGDAPAYIFSLYLPRYQIFASVFCIRGADGDYAPHRVNPGKVPYMRDSFVRLDAHSTQRFSVDLGMVYDLPNGPVDIAYDAVAFYDRAQADPGPNDAPAGRTTSNTLHMWINRSLLRTPEQRDGNWGRQISINPHCAPKPDQDR